MTFAMHVSDVTCKELNLSEGSTAVIVESTEQKKGLIGPPVFLVSVPELDSCFMHEVCVFSLYAAKIFRCLLPGSVQVLA